MGNLDFNADEYDDPISFDVMPDGTVIDVEIESTEQKENSAKNGSYLEIVFLCTDAARHITGEIIRVDGGQALS